MDKYNETKTDSQILRTNRWLPEGRAGKQIDEGKKLIYIYIYTHIYKYFTDLT